jgi:hypothetical protein
MAEYGDRSKMLPTHHRAEGKWDKWSVNSMSKLLAVALVLLLSLQIVASWNGRSLLQIPCPFLIRDRSLSTPSPNPSSAIQATDLPALQRNCSCTQAVVLPVVLTNCTQADDDELKPTEHRPPPNSYFPDTDSDIWPCRQHHVDERTMTYHDWLTGGFTDEQALCAAHRVAKRLMAPGAPRIAFLFLTRGDVPLEPLWKKL